MILTWNSISIHWLIYSFRYSIFNIRVCVSCIAWTRSKTIDAIEVPILAVITSIILCATFGIIAVRTVWPIELATDAIVSIRATERWKLKCMSKDRILRPNQPRTLKIPPTSNRSLIGVAMNRAAAFSRAPIEHSSINSNKKANNFINNILFYSFFLAISNWIENVFSQQRKNERLNVALLKGSSWISWIQGNYKSIDTMR